jgi:hypothetical protein
MLNRTRRQLAHRKLEITHPDLWRRGKDGCLDKDGDLYIWGWDYEGIHFD